MNSLIIHMSSSAARRPNVARLLQDLPDAQVVDAVNGRDPAQVAGIRTHPGNLHRPAYPFPLTPAEIGVFQSHRKCWQMIIDQGWDYAIIAEDDLAVSSPEMIRAKALIADHMTPDMYVRLPPKLREKPATVFAKDGEMALILPRVIGLQCCCQVVGREAAKLLLQGTSGKLMRELNRGRYRMQVAMRPQRV